MPLCAKPPGAAPTSEPLQPLLLPLLPHHDEQGHAQGGQDDGAADGEQLLHVVALALGRFDGRDGAWAGAKEGVRVSEESAVTFPAARGLTPTSTA